MKYLFYTLLANNYDRIYTYVDYEKQVTFLAKILETYSVPGNKILDFACGTGKHAALLSKMGSETIGVDLSPEMLEVAKRLHPEIKFYLGDMRNWKGPIKFSAITILFNSILYSKNSLELKETLHNCYEQLIVNGVLIFDTVDKSIGIGSRRKAINGKNLSFSPKWIYNPKNDYMDLDIDFVIDGQKIHDQHHMGAFTITEQKQFAEDAGFKVSILERRFDEIKLIGGKDKKAILVCQKV